MKKQFIILIITALFQRIGFAGNLHQKIRKTMQVRFKKQITIGQVRLKFLGIQVNNLTIVEDDRDFGLAVSQLTLKINFGMCKRPQWNIHAQGIRCRISAPAAPANQAKPLHGGRQMSQPRNFYNYISQKFARFCTLPFQNLQLENFEVDFNMKGSKNVRLNNLTLIKNIHTDRTFVKAYMKNPEISVRADNEQPFEFNSSFLDVSFKVHSSGNSHALNLEWLTGPARFDCSYIMEKEMCIDPLEIKLSGIFDQTGFKVTETSLFKFNKLYFSILFTHLFQEDDAFYLGLDLCYCKMDDIKKSFPYFVNKDIYSVAFQGGLGFETRLTFKSSNPWDYDFKWKFNKDMKVSDLGTLQFDFLKSGFMHQAVRNGSLVRELNVTEDNPHFTRFGDLPQILVDTVVCCEDPGYYRHKGIQWHAIGFALLTNILTKKFMRGASTISMQLIRNLFLDHKKNIYRKLEEIVLTWILENMLPIGKDRQLEIYFNIVEFGPSIYGISEAAEYYFGKRPKDLSLEECLAVTYILPRPTFFHAKVTERSPELSQKLSKHFDWFSREMVVRKYIDHDEFNRLDKQVRIRDWTLQLSETIENLEPYLKETYVRAVEAWVERHPYLPRPFIACTHRSNSYQASLYEQGRIKPGAIITDAAAGLSPHNCLPSQAFDIAFKNIHNKVEWSEDLFKKFAELVSEVDTQAMIVWGGSFVNIRDLGHFEKNNWNTILTNRNYANKEMAS
jgi:hypothetical protein